MAEVGHNRPPTGSAEALVRFDNVQKSYDGETLVVKDLDLAIRRGEFLTLLGPSGSGKTTTLLMLAGFEMPTHGDIVLDGQSLRTVPPHKRGIGMVFQNYALFPHMTVAENLAFPLQARKMDKAEQGQRIKRALEMVELGSYDSRRPGQLSGGQQQRVALARALVFDPKLVLMDEPLGALDKKLRSEVQIELKQLHQRLGTTFVYVTHDQSEALTMSNRIAVFNEGEVQQLATPEELYERPQNAFVAQFIGENNRFWGTVKGHEGNFCAVELDHGEQVQALAVNIDGAGGRTSLSLRPEAIFVEPAEGACDNLFPARIEELIYMGDHTRVRVDVLGNSDFVIKVPRGASGRTLEAGTTIRIGWRSEDCRALDAA